MLKRGSVRIVLVVVVMLLMTATVAYPQQQRKKVAVVLSGGGAKGMAHIGALKVIERAGIPIDYIVGTSMGAIVGGLYSIGYDAQMLDSMVRQQDWKFLLSDHVDPRNQSMHERYNHGTYLLSRPIIRQGNNDVMGGLVTGYNLTNLFSRLTVGYHDSTDFRNLPIPFACVATNMVDYSEVDLHSGWLAQTMRASMAIPGFFTPVRIDSMVLVDGGLKNNYPVDVARNMGADIVIGVTLDKPMRSAAELKSGSDILMQLLDFNVKNKYDDNLRHTDVPIAVDVNGYSSTSFSTRAIDTLIYRGEKAAMGQWDSLIALKQKIGVDSNYMPLRIHRASNDYLTHKVRLSVVDMYGIGRFDQRYITRKFHLNEGDSINSEQLEQAMTALRSDLMYSSAEYILRQMPGGYWLRITAGNRKITQASVGVRFDTEEMVGLQANSELRLPTRLPIELSVTGRLGKRYMANVAATFMPTNFRNVTLAYTFRHNDINQYNKGNRDFNVTYNYHALNLSLININGKNYSMDLTARWENFNYEDVLIGQRRDPMPFGDEHFYSYNFRLHYDSENERYFTTRGAKLEAGYSLYTDDFVKYCDHSPLHIISGQWRVASRLNSRLTLQPTAYGRIIFGEDVPWCLSNFIGGDFAGHYIDQQLPFAGIGNIEATGNAFIAAGLKLQQRIMDNNYIILRTTIAMNSDKLRNFHHSGLMQGYQLSWAYDSLFGPINANLGYSGITKKVYFYLNLGFEF